MTVRWGRGLPDAVQAAVRLSAVLVTLSVTSIAAAEPPRVCFDAVERGQTLRDQAKLREARTAFLSCAASACPPLIQHDCTQWVTELEARIPTLIVTASDAADHDLVNVRLTVDGEPFLSRLDGIAVPIDPGIHTFRFESPAAEPLDQQVVVREADKSQKLHVVLQPRAAPQALAPAPTTENAPRRGPPIGAIVAGSVGVVALGSFAYFGITGASDVHHLESTCAPACGHGESDAARRELLAADISLGIGVVAIAVATWLYLDWRRPASGSSAFTQRLGVAF